MLGLYQTDVADNLSCTVCFNHYPTLYLLGC